jgi:hypothetical protein
MGAFFRGWRRLWRRPLRGNSVLALCGLSKKNDNETHGEGSMKSAFFDWPKFKLLVLYARDKMYYPPYPLEKIVFLSSWLIETVQYALLEVGMLNFSWI